MGRGRIGRENRQVEKEGDEDKERGTGRGEERQPETDAGQRRRQ